MLSLRDPADETNDLGRKGIAIKHVQATLRALHQQLEYNIRVNTRASILAPLVGPSYMLDQTRRRKLDHQGKYIMNQVQTSLAAKAKALRDAETDGVNDTDAEAEADVKTEAAEQQTEQEAQTEPLAKQVTDEELQSEHDTETNTITAADQPTTSTTVQSTSTPASAEDTSTMKTSQQ